MGDLLGTRSRNLFIFRWPEPAVWLHLALAGLTNQVFGVPRRKMKCSGGERDSSLWVSGVMMKIKYVKSLG